MDSQQGKLISTDTDIQGNQNNPINTQKQTIFKNNVKQENKRQNQGQGQGVQKIIQKEKPKIQQKHQQIVQQGGPIDVIKQLTQNKNPLPILAVLEKIDLQTKTKDGVPLFNLLMNKFLPLQDLLQKSKIKFLPDEDGRTPLHYAVQVDDPKAVFWLLKKGAENTTDKFGNTPVMDAVRLGHRRSFLLCMHFQHINQELPHVAAKYNRVWQLRCMLALGLNLFTKNIDQRTPLQVAVQSYSYDAAQYLGMINQYYPISSLKSMIDSGGIISKVLKGKNSYFEVERIFKPLLFKFAPLFIIYMQLYFMPCYQKIQDYVNLVIFVLWVLYALMFLISLIFKPKPKQAQSILSLLHQPQFPNSTDHICPSCMRRYHHQKEDHCDICHICVPKFHQHKVFCINKYNQIVWYIFQYTYLYLVWLLLSQAVSYSKVTYNSYLGQQPSFLSALVYFNYQLVYKEENYQAAIFLVFIFGLTIQQLLICLQLFGMAFMNRTYQQTTRTQDYNHLYSVFKNKQGKLKTKQMRIFHKYKLLGGICFGIRNILCYFC